MAEIMLKCRKPENNGLLRKKTPGGNSKAKRNKDG